MSRIRSGLERRMADEVEPHAKSKLTVSNCSWTRQQGTEFANAKFLGTSRHLAASSWVRCGSTGVRECRNDLAKIEAPQGRSEGRDAWRSPGLVRS